jgi:HTH-type transcriptional regulator, glycine betaine synthesis regulator
MNSSVSAANQETRPADGFIRLWGEMGTHWGVPRTMTQVHALLFIEGRSLNTDDIMARLSISRGNASMTLRTLVDWGMITRTHNPRDRKDYYAAEQDVWKLFATIARARKRREIEPLIGSLKQVLDQSAGADDADTKTQRAKIEEVLAFTRLFDAVAEQFLAAGPDALGNLSSGR